MKKIIDQIKESVVFLGYVNDGQEQIIGTGFLMQIEGIFHLVTARHVIEKNWQNLHVFLNSKHLKQPSAKPLSVVYQAGNSWIRHPDPKVDIAVIPFLMDVNDKVKFVPDNLISKDNSELYELVDVFFVSFQPGLNNFQIDGCINPIIRKGVISRMNSDYTFYIDGSAFPGNSGSPVFVFPSAVKISDEGVQIGGQMKITLAGVMGAYVPYRDVAASQQTGNVRVIFEENTGLSLVWSTKFIDEIISCADFRNQIGNIKALIQKSLPLDQAKEISK
jgi:hypothetical protein